MERNNDISAATRNSIFAVILQVTTVIYGFLVPRFVLSYFGSELNGLVSSITQFMQYLVMLESGLSVAAIYSLFKPLADQDDEGCRKVVSECAFDYNKIGFMFTGLLLALAVIFPAFKNASSLNYLDCSILIIAIGLSNLINYFIFAKYRALLNASQDQYILSISTIFNLAVSTITVYLCIGVLHTNIVFMKMVCAVVPIVQYPIIATYARRKFPWIKGCRAHNYRMIKNRGTAFANEIFGVIFYSSPVILLTAFSNLLTVSVYSVYNLIYAGITGLFGSVNMAVSALFGPYIAQKKYDLTRQRYASFEGMYYYGSSLILGCACALTIPFIALYTAGVEDIEYCEWIYAVLFAANCWMNNAYTPQAIMIRAAGLFREVRLQTIIQTVLSVILSLILTPLFGIVGLLSALIVSNLIRLGMAYWVIDVKSEYIDHVYSMKCLLISGLQMCITSAVLPFLLHVVFGTVDTIMQFILAGFLSVFAAAAIMMIVLVILDRKAIAHIWDFMKALLKKRGQ